MAGVALGTLLTDMILIFLLKVRLVESRLSFNQLLPMMPIALGVCSTYSITSAVLFVAATFLFVIGLPPRMLSSAKCTALDFLLSNTNRISPLLEPLYMSLQFRACPLRMRLISFTLIQVSVFSLLTINAKPSYAIFIALGINLLSCKFFNSLSLKLREVIARHTFSLSSILIASSSFV